MRPFLAAIKKAAPQDGFSLNFVSAYSPPKIFIKNVNILMNVSKREAAPKACILPCMLISFA